jgi:hypothetical protein
MITTNQAHLLGAFCYSMLECYMGKNKLKSNSIPELIWNTIVTIYKGVQK